MKTHPRPSKYYPETRYRLIFRKHPDIRHLQEKQKKLPKISCVFLPYGIECHEVVCSILLSFDALFSDVVKNLQRRHVFCQSQSPLSISFKSLLFLIRESEAAERYIPSQKRPYRLLNDFSRTTFLLIFFIYTYIMRCADDVDSSNDRCRLECDY